MARSTRLRPAGLAAAALLFGAYLMLAAVPAQAATNDNATCLYNAVNRQVTVSSSTGSLSIVVGSGGAILFDNDTDASDGTACDTATVNNTDGITAESDLDFVIDLSGGPFAPGETPEASGISEIEIDVDGAVNTMEDVRVDGSDGDDTITAGNGLNAPTGSIVLGGAINLNSDGDADVTFNDNGDGSNDFEIQGGEGNDTISANGGSGTGAFLEQDSDNLEGDEGNDTITGSNYDTGDGDSPIEGDEGNDVLIGNGGDDDLLDSGAIDDTNGDGQENCLDNDESDSLSGGDGSDCRNAGAGRDLLAGGNGDDNELGNGCNDVLDQGNGPNGADVLDGDAGEPGGPFDCDGTDDLVDYSQRNSDLDVSLGDGNFNDGEVGANEQDNVTGGIETVLGGSGDDSSEEFLGHETFFA